MRYTRLRNLKHTSRTPFVRSLFLLVWVLYIPACSGVIGSPQEFLNGVRKRVLVKCRAEITGNSHHQDLAAA